MEKTLLRSVAHVNWKNRENEAIHPIMIVKIPTPATFSELTSPSPKECTVLFKIIIIDRYITEIGIKAIMIPIKTPRAVTSWAVPRKTIPNKINITMLPI